MKGRVERGLALCVGLLVACGCPPSRAAPAGLYVRNGTLMHSGKPYRAMGVNYYTCFNMLIDQPERDILPAGERSSMLEAVGEFNERCAIGEWE